ncbi:MAG: hypothetical protein CL908_22895 [Deltaproteobacteria bacterium]|nr:hypothetical protein [Deltaproteobacteria bacterium]
MGRHGLEVPALCLGAMMFGLQVDEKGSREILDKAYDQGLTFLCDQALGADTPGSQQLGTLA